MSDLAPLVLAMPVVRDKTVEGLMEENDRLRKQMKALVIPISISFVKPNDANQNVETQNGIQNEHQNENKGVEALLGDGLLPLSGWERAPYLLVGRPGKFKQQNIIIAMREKEAGEFAHSEEEDALQLMDAGESDVCFRLKNEVVLRLGDLELRNRHARYIDRVSPEFGGGGGSGVQCNLEFDFEAKEMEQEMSTSKASLLDFGITKITTHFEIEPLVRAEVTVTVVRSVQGQADLSSD
jgi:hypothetical protein